MYNTLNVQQVMYNTLFVQRMNVQHLECTTYECTTTWIYNTLNIIISLLILKLVNKQESLSQSYEYLIVKDSVAGEKPCSEQESS